MAYYISVMEAAFIEVRMHNDIAFNGYYCVESICLIKLIGKQVHLVNGSLAWFIEGVQASYCQPSYGSMHWYHWFCRRFIAYKIESFVSLAKQIIRLIPNGNSIFSI